MTGSQNVGERTGRLLSFMVLATPLVVARGFLFPFIIPKAFYFQALVTVALVLLALGWLHVAPQNVRTDISRAARDPFLQAFLAFTALEFLAGALGEAPSRSLLGTLERRWGAQTWAAFAGFYLLLRVWLDDEGWRRALQAAAAVALAVALYGIVGAWPGQPEPVGWSRISSTLGNPGYLAPYLTQTAVLTCYLALRSGAIWRWFWFAAAAVQATAVLLAGTRAVVVGAGVAALALTVAWVVNGSSSRLRWGAATGFAVLAGIGLIGLLSSGEGHPGVISWSDRLLSALSTETGSARFRLVTWGATLDAVWEAPLLGVGPENFHLVWSRHFNPAMYHLSTSPALDRAHNVLVERATTTGLLGMVAYLAMWGALGWTLYQSWRRGRLSGLEASLLAFGVLSYAVYLLFWFEDHSSFLAFVVVAALVGHVASAGGSVEDGIGGAGVNEEGGAAGPSSPPQTISHGSSSDSFRLLRIGVPAVLLLIAGSLAWHNVRVLNTARNAWNGEHSSDAWDGVESFRAALAPGLPGSERILHPYLRRLTFLAGHGDGGAPEGPTPRMMAALATADSALTAWASRDPRNPWVYIQRFRYCGIRRDVMGRTKGRECAAESLRRAIELSPRQIHYRHWLANHHLSAGNPGRALNVLEEALQVYDSFGETYHYIARVRLQTGEMDEAVRQARIAISLGYGRQPAPFILELADLLVEDGRVGEAADLVESHLSLVYQKLERPDLETPPGRGFQPWDLPLASRLPLLHLRAERSEEAIRTAEFLAHRLGRKGDEPGNRHEARIRRFIDDVEAGRTGRWKGMQTVLDSGGEQAKGAETSNPEADPRVDGSIEVDETGVRLLPNPASDEELGANKTDERPGASSVGPGFRSSRLHDAGADGSSDGDRLDSGDRCCGLAEPAGDDRAPAGRVGVPGKVVPGEDAGDHPSRRRADSDQRARRADTDSSRRPPRQSDQPPGRTFPGGLSPPAAVHAAIQQPWPGGTGQPLSVPWTTGGPDRQQLLGTAADRAVHGPLSRGSAALFSRGMHRLRRSTHREKAKTLCANTVTQGRHLALQYG